MRGMSNVHETSIVNEPAYFCIEGNMVNVNWYTGLEQSFNCNPLSSNPLEIICPRKEIPEGGVETMDLLARLLEILRSNELDDDILSDLRHLDDLITEICM